MKKLAPFMLIAMVLSLMFLGCSKDGTTPKKTSTKAPYNMSATVGGVAFSRDSCVFAKMGSELLGWAGYPKTKSDYYPHIHIYFSGYHGVGTYNFSLGGNYAKIKQSDTSEDHSFIGNITVTDTSTNIVGTFNFTTVSGIEVTNGSFTALID